MAQAGGGSARLAAPREGTPIGPTAAPMPAEQSVLLAEFARACKTAARSVSLYPGTHPSIDTSLVRIMHAADRLTADGALLLTVHPDRLTANGRAPVRHDPAIGDLASLLHERQVGSLRIEHGVTAINWRALLLLLARAPDTLRAEGGIAAGWATMGGSGFQIQEIDYAEVLRERAGGDTPDWDRIVACCLRGETTELDSRAAAALLETIGDAASFGELLARVHAAPAEGPGAVQTRIAAVLRLLRLAIDAARGDHTLTTEAVVQAIADAIPHFSPEMLVALLAQRTSGATEDAQVASAVAGHASDGAIAGFVAGSVAAERGATGRLAQAFEALVPDTERKARLLDLAKEEVAQTDLGAEPGFDALWDGAVDMLMSYSDGDYVSPDYERELSGARTQAIDVERVSDDPPERVLAWLATVSASSLERLDLQVLCDVLRLEADPVQWEMMAAIAATEIERRTLIGDVCGARQLAAAVGSDGRASLRAAADAVGGVLAAGPLGRHIVLHLRRAAATDMEPLHGLCLAIGPRLVGPLAEALAAEENTRAIGRLRELLLGFGADGRHSVEQLKSSSNPAVRRVAIDLLRVLGGHRALPDLASMLHDADPQVQRASIRAIVEMATTSAYEVLEEALVGDSASRDTIVQQLIGFRDDRAVPLLCYVLDHTSPRGRLAQVHADVIEALGGLSGSAESLHTLRQALSRGRWWTPFRTAALRRAAAVALRRIGSPDALAVLQAAAESGIRGVQAAARAQVEVAARRERERA